MRPTGSTFYYFFFILFLFSNTYAQVFPVQGSLQMLPPFSPYLTDYTTPGSQKITLQLRSNDIALSDHPIRLRFSIEGVGISIRTKPGYIPPVPHTLMGGGAPTLFYGEDLLDYFSPDNLDFAGFSRSDFQKSAKLPEGVYRFSFEVFDYYRQVPLSSKITMVTWIVLNDPPLLNLPLNQAKVSLIDPVNIAFTWTPRHTASPNAAFSTEYVFKLVEIWPADRNPYDAFLSQTPLYETTTTESQLIYSPAEPALITGRKYAWQVQARDENGRDIFKNQGKSEVFVFQFGDGPGIPENLHKQSGNTQTLTLLWDSPARGGADQYNIRYKTTAENKWSETLSDQPWVTLTSLQANTDYDVQVRSKREDLYSDYTAALRVKTDEKAREFTCGQAPATINTDKTSRLLQLTPGDVFTCNDWRIVVIEAIRSANGEYAGKGMMAVKMFNGASVEVAFHGAINANNQLITGGVESTYKKDSEMGKVVEEMHKIGEKKKDTTKTNIDSLPLPQLQELAQSLIDIPQKKIDNATVLNREEKQQINGARTKAKEALKTLNDPKATAKEKKEAEKNLRKAVAGAKPAMDKLTNSSDKDKQALADRWFKNIMDFLNAYNGNETGKKQAIVWHNRMDSMVNALSKKTGVPNDLMKAMLDAHQNAKTAWASLEKGTDGIRPKGPRANFEEGYTPEDIALCKENVKTAEAVAKALGISQYTADNGTGIYPLTGTHSFITPTGNLITLDALTEVRFVSSFQGKIPAGALIGFTLTGGETFVACYNTQFSKFHFYVNTKNNKEQYIVKNLPPQAEAYLGYPENCVIKVYSIPSSQVTSSNIDAIPQELNFPSKKQIGSAKDDEACLKTEEAKDYFTKCTATAGTAENASKTTCYAAAKAMDLLDSLLLKACREVYGIAQNNIYLQAIVQRLADQLQSFLAEYNKTLTNLQNTSDAKVVITLLRSWGRSKYETLSAADRLHLLKVLSSVNLSDIKNAATVFTTGYGGENVVLALLQHAPTGQSKEICDGLEAIVNGKALLIQLMERMDNWGWGNNNRTKFFVAINNLFQKTQRAAKENVTDKDVYYLSNYEDPTICHKEGPLNIPFQSLSDNGQITLQQNYSIDTLCSGDLGKKIIFNDAKTYKPFDAIGLVYFRYPAASIVPRDKEGKIIIYPAIFMKYHKEQWWENVNLQFGIDVGQLALSSFGFGQLAKVSTVWKILAATDAVVNSADFVIRKPAIRQKILATQDGSELLKYWGRAVLGTNVLILSPAATSYLYSSVKQYKTWKAGKNLVAELGGDAAKLEADMALVERKLEIRSVNGGSIASQLTGALRNTYDEIIRAGGSAIENNGTLKILSKNGDEVAQISNGKILPTKYFDEAIHAGATPIGRPANGYQVFKKGDNLIVKRIPDRSAYSSSELTELTQHPDAHVLERHGHDVTDEALIKRANEGIAPDGSTIGNPTNPVTPPYSSKFENPQKLQLALEKTRPGTPAFAKKTANQYPNGYNVEFELIDGSFFGRGIPRNKNTFENMKKVLASYEETSPGVFKLITMYPIK